MCRQFNMPGQLSVWPICLFTISKPEIGRIKNSFSSSKRYFFKMFVYYNNSMLLKSHISFEMKINEKNTRIILTLKMKNK